MNLYQEILSSFEFLGIKVEEKVVNKCVDICTKQNISAEELVDQWCAYTASKLNGAEPSVEALKAMERKEYGKHTESDLKANKSNSAAEDVTAIEEMETNFAGTTIIADTPKRIKSVKRLRSPDTTASPTPAASLTYSQGGFSPISYSPSVSSQSTSYAERQYRGSVVTSFGNRNLLQKASFKRKTSIPLQIELLPEQDHLTANALYMYNPIKKKTFALNSITMQVGNQLKDKFNLDEYISVTKQSLGALTTFGRICSDSKTGLTHASALLEEPVVLSQGHMIKLNLSKLPSYAIFPGQIAAIEGQGVLQLQNEFVVQNLLTDASLPLPNLPQELQNLPEPLQIVVAAGPFTMENDMLYQPLEDLVKYVSQHKPHVLILIGPFIDSSHANVRDGSMAEPFDTFFEHLIDKIMEPLKDLDVQVVLISSPNDIHHRLVYPTPPYELKKKYPNLQCFPDPAVISINGIVFAATSADILHHLSNSLVYKPPEGDRLKRLVGQLLSQLSFYPLYPPHRSMRIDYHLLAQYGMLPVTPHVLILPSNLPHFIKDVHGCAVINPERLANNFRVGTFARLEIHPAAVNSLCESVAFQLITI